MNDWIFGVTGVGPLLDQLHDHLPGTDGVERMSKIFDNAPVFRSF